MPPKKAAAASAAKAPKTAPAATKKVAKAASTAAAKKTEDKKASAPKKAAPKKAAPVKKAAPAAKPAAAPKKEKASVPAEESDKENSGAPSTQAKGATKPKKDAEPAKTEKKKAVAEPKRKRATAEDDEADEEPEEKRAPKKQKQDATARPAPKPVPAPRPRKLTKKINTAPSNLLELFVFGEGSSGELGLGSVKVDGKKPIDVKRPRLNPNLKNIVQLSCGGMHVIALTKENKLLTWGVNDQGALGRDTTWDGGLRDVDNESSDDEDDDDTGLNPNESNPGEVDLSNVEENTTFVQVAASDSASFALTEEGKVYGWGTFRSNEGIIGFTKDGVLVEKIPVLLSDLKHITQIVAGSNHVLALDDKGKIFAWGSGQQGQLARKLVERDMNASLKPQGIGALPKRAKAATLACGSYHSFVIDTKGRVFAWGLNNYGELALEDNVGSDEAMVMRPTFVDSLEEFNIVSIAGGEHHSIACTDDGKLLTWGRIDGHQVGLPASAFNEDNAMFDEHKKPRILMKPTVVPGIPPIASVAAGTDHSFAITRDGKAYSWGFSANYQTGQGTDDDIEAPTLIDNTAVRAKKLEFAGAGGQYSVLGSLAEDVEMKE